MRKITFAIKTAFDNKVKAHLGNTMTDGNNVWLFGNHIIQRKSDIDIRFNLCGHNTATTRERLRNILNISLICKKGELYYKDELIDLYTWYIVV